MYKTFTKAIAVIAFVFSFSISFAQETSSSFSGVVVEGINAVVNATISAKHEPTGFVVNTQSNNKGFFVLANLKPGGPYTIKITHVGFKEEVIKDVYLTLGNNPDVKVALQNNSSQLTELVVTGSARKSSGGVVVGNKQMQTLPSIGRSLADFTRLTPQSNNNSFAGSNFRYNNLTLDGAVNNDAIGFSNSAGGVSGGGQSGAAGAGTRTVPYSIDVIQEVQVQLAPYDVKLGNFTGGSVNAVTKSGTNNFHGSVYAYTKNLFNSALFGKSVDGKKEAMSNSFYEHQYGATFGGPIVKNKAFFILNFEQTRRQEPTFYNAGDAGSPVTTVLAQQIADTFKARGFDAGSYGANKIFTNSDKFFARFDFNINAKNNLMVRALYTKGWGNNIERSTGNFQFASTDFTQYTNNINLVAELKTKVNNVLSNQLLVSYINVHEYRDFPGTVSPFVDIANTIWLGTWREASVYNMKQSTFEITDNITLKSGINKFTFGTHNEFYNLTYGFVNSWNGRWQYNSVNDFFANKPARIRGTFATDATKNTRDNIYNNAPNPYSVALMSVYGQDEISLAKNFKLTAGVRFDYSHVAEQPYTDAELNKASNDAYVSNNPTFNFTPFQQLNNKWLGKVNISPRLGFNWDVKNNGNIVVRGGAGTFVGRMPFAWLGYAYTLSGNYYGNIDYAPNGAKVVGLTNAENLKSTIDGVVGNNSATKTRELDIIDNNFKLPTILRTNIAADFKFGKGYKFTVDVLYTKTLSDVKFQQINLIDSVRYYTSGPTETPIYLKATQAGNNNKRNANFSNVYFLTNTSEGYRYNITAQLSKTTNNINLGKGTKLDLNWMLAYTYGVSKDMSNGIRNSFQSNFEVNPSINPNNPTLAYSNFDLRHRIVAVVGTNFKWNDKNATSLNFFYSGQSGSPYSLIYSSAGAFGAGSNAALPYIPKDEADAHLVDAGTYTASQQWQDLNNFIEGDAYLKTRRGQYAERNALHTPWNHNLDMKLMHEFKFKNGKSLQVSFDVMNVLNLLNNDWGHITFVTNTNNYTVPFMKFVNTAGNTPTFNFVKPTANGQYYTVDPINSRWQGQLGLKFNF